MLAMSTAQILFNKDASLLISNFLREQIKDLQDFPGDAACGCNTLAVLKGPRFAKKPAGITGLILAFFLAVMLVFWQQTQAPEWQIWAGVGLLLFPTLGATIVLYRAKGKPDFDIAAGLIKLVMVAGVFLLLRVWPEDILGAAHAYWTMIN